MYVVVNKNNEINIYLTWDECFKKVNGISGNKGYKKIKNEEEFINFVYDKTGFSSEEIANLYSNGDINTNGAILDFTKVVNIEKKIEKIVQPKPKQDPQIEFPENVPCFYVDGSFNANTGEYGSGIVIVRNGIIVGEFSESNYDKEFSKLMNVAGEVTAARLSIDIAKEKKLEEIVICYDYKGIELWAINEEYCGIRSFSDEKSWRTNKEGTKEYKECMFNAHKKIKIHFKKIKAHSGDIFNDRADELARNVIGLNFKQKKIGRDKNEKEWIEAKYNKTQGGR